MLRGKTSVFSSVFSLTISLSIVSAHIALAFGLSACGEQPSTFAPTNTDTFTNYTSDTYQQADQLLEADYVFDIDTSYSMSQFENGSVDKLTQLANSLQNFTNDLTGSGINYQIGFIQGTIQAENLADIQTTFMAPILSNDATLFSDIKNQLSQVGQPLQPNTPVLLEAARQTMTAQSGTFIRQGAQLVYVFISDNDDQSENLSLSGNTSVTGYASALKSFKSSSAFVSARAVVGGMSSSCPLQNDFDVAGNRLANVAYYLDSQNAAPDCLYTDFSTTLQNLAQNVTKPTTEFALRETPLYGNVQVEVNGQNVPSTGNWSYVASSNTIIFFSGKQPAYNASLVIQYQVGFYLSQTPNVSTIVVTIGGNTINQDPSNGWTYIPGENRISFNGSSVPANGAQITVTYQLGSN